MNPDQRPQQVEDACTSLLAGGQPVTFDAVAERTGLGRATLYRHPELRAIIDEHRTRGREANTLTALSAEIAHLRTAVNELAARVRKHEEELRTLKRAPRRD
jgi:hypothetical protein